ncbi:hypothetical protein SDC9_42079 [bioreactor metagenome]|jgi:hypothetical protein|uniref:Uncharacterized protein n=1 Tax=bioreactor metagenome TaxID=1076179 RepID=A0A644VX67_9ZZZZ|nr:hypothetical protein [Paludibacter sp.]
MKFILIPFCRIINDIMSNPVICMFVSDNYFVAVVLPYNTSDIDQIKKADVLWDNHTPAFKEKV